MTLIASIINHDVPFLMSDLLMSSLNGKDNFESPSNNFPLKRYLPKYANNKPDSLLQKSYIIKDNLSIVFGGDENEIREFLKEFKIQCNYYDDIRKENIFKILDNYDLNVKFKKSAFVMVVINKINDDNLDVGIITTPFPSNNWDIVEGKKGGWAEIRNENYGKVTAWGSGRDSFLNIVNQDLKVVSNFAEDHIWRAIQINLALIARIYALEKATLYTILSNWGGGFETIMYDGKKFTKYQNIAFVINQGRFDENGDVNLPFPTTILYYRYYNDYLLITGIHLKNTYRVDEGSLIKIISNPNNYEIKNVVVPQFDSEEGTFDDSTYNYNFKTSTVAMGYDIRKITTNGTFNPGTFNFHDEITVSYIKDGAVELVMSKDINTKFRELAKDAYPKV